MLFAVVHKIVKSKVKTFLKKTEKSNGPKLSLRKTADKKKVPWLW